MHVGRSRRRAPHGRHAFLGNRARAWACSRGRRRLARAHLSKVQRCVPLLSGTASDRAPRQRLFGLNCTIGKSRKRDMIVKNCRLDRRPAPPWRILPVHASCGFSEGFRAPHPTGSEHGVGHRARAAPSCTVATGCGASLSFAQARGRACPPRVRACLLQASLQHDAARHYSGHNSRHGGDVHRRSRRSRPASLRAPPESGFC